MITNVNDTQFVYEECQKNLQKRKEDIIPKNCKLQEKKTYLKHQVKQQGTQITCILVFAKLQDIVRKKRGHRRNIYENNNI